MLRPKYLFADRQRTLKKWPRPRKVTLVFQQQSEIVEALRRPRMFRPEYLLTDRQRALAKGPSFIVARERKRRIVGEPVQQITRVRFTSRRRCGVGSDDCQCDGIEAACTRPCSCVIVHLTGI